MIEPEPMKKLSKKYQLKLDEEVAQRLQAEFDEQERIQSEKAKANIALKETWDDIQAKIEVDQYLAERLQEREQEELTIEERAILFQQLLEKRRKHFAAKRAEEKRNRPPTKAQQRSIMCTYLKNMEGWKPKDLKNKSFDSIQKLFDKAMKRSSSKRAGDELEQESIKKQKVDEDKETAELKSLMEVIPDEEEVAVDAIPLATKPPSIVDWKIHKEGKKSYYQIIKTDGSSKMYLVFSHMLKSFDRKDLETLYKLVKAKYGSTRPVEDLDLVLYGDLKTMFDPNVEDQYFEIQDLKAQLQDRDIAISELEKLIEKSNGNSVGTKFDKPLVVRQTNAIKLPKPSVLGNVMIKRVYYVKGLNHNLFSLGQFCHVDMEVAFKKSTCYIRDLQENDLHTGTRGSDLYTIALQESSSPTPIYFLAKASPTQAWLWHRKLSHLNFDTINLISKNDIVNGLPKLKFVKDQLCSSYEVGNAKKQFFQDINCYKIEEMVRFASYRLMWSYAD
ncbi:retrovirus-related pol polyprotein from transposon TNT 1-94 [Tanacetum coccineum]|uniref:Retrovirus-related pol polyprotein from transposon TNT 1-94 n=1 Tax=Tanacetum coccineum TaxID=301880 RepID=A0ABQ4YTS9_9ASTR